jgi:hypothetical protein
LNGCVIPVLETNCEFTVVFLARGDHRVSVPGRHRHGFLANDVSARIKAICA